MDGALGWSALLRRVCVCCGMALRLVEPAAASRTALPSCREPRSLVTVSVSCGARAPCGALGARTRANPRTRVFEHVQVTMVMVRDILMYMDRTYVAQNKKTAVYDVGLQVAGGGTRVVTPSFVIEPPFHLPPFLHEMISSSLFLRVASLPLLGAACVRPCDRATVRPCGHATTISAPRIAPPPRLGTQQQLVRRTHAADV